MSVLKRIVLLICLVQATQSFAQNLPEIFAKSYASEKIANYKEAIAVIQAQYAGESYEMNLRLGWLYYLDKKYAESVSHYQKACLIKKGAIEPIFGIIYPYSAQEKWNLVEQSYKEILVLDPKNTKANYYMGTIFYYRKDYTQAKKYFGEVIGLYPFDRESNLMMGWCCYWLGSRGEAKSYFTKALINKPDDTSALEGLSLCK